MAFLDQAPEPADNDAAPPAPRIPLSAVQQDGERSVIYLISNDQAQRRAVTLGQRAGDTVEVLGGLSGGERIAGSEVDKLRDGQAVRIE